MKSIEQKVKTKLDESKTSNKANDKADHQGKSTGINSMKKNIDNLESSRFQSE